MRNGPHQAPSSEKQSLIIWMNCRPNDSGATILAWHMTIEQAIGLVFSHRPASVRFTCGNNESKVVEFASRFEFKSEIERPKLLDALRSVVHHLAVAVAA